ncbi:MAG TPA: hypothetical protein PL037_07175, partial [Elusimicrobiales bacterium]|nr:hypothetical protein [Elusimicrobiales bacterium]
MYSSFLFGAFSLLTQIYALKELSGILTGHEASLGLGLSAWLLWTAAGMSLAFKTRIARNNYGSSAFPAACLILSTTAALNLLLLRKAGLLMTPGLSPGLLQLILFSFLIPLPAAIANGAALALGLSTRRLAFYRAEAAGAAGAGLLTLAHAAYFPWVDPLLLCGATAAALLLSVAAKTGPKIVRALPAAFVSLLFAGGMSIVPPFALPSS